MKDNNLPAAIRNLFSQIRIFYKALPNVDDKANFTFKGCSLPFDKRIEQLNKGLNSSYYKTLVATKDDLELVKEFFYWVC